MVFLLLPLMAFAAPAQLQAQSKPLLGERLIASPRIVASERAIQAVAASGRKARA